MLLFQILLILVVVLAGILAVRVLPGERSLAVKRIFAILLMIAAVASIMFPSLLTTVAHFFGIGRGTDLLLYLAIVGMIVFAVAVVRAKARSDARVTSLARSVALMEARLREGVATGSEAAGPGAPANDAAADRPSPEQPNADGDPTR